MQRRLARLILGFFLAFVLAGSSILHLRDYLSRRAEGMAPGVTVDGFPVGRLKTREASLVVAAAAAFDAARERTKAHEQTGGEGTAEPHLARSSAFPGTQGTLDTALTLRLLSRSEPGGAGSSIRRLPAAADLPVLTPAPPPDPLLQGTILGRTSLLRSSVPETDLEPFLAVAARLDRLILRPGSFIDLAGLLEPGHPSPIGLCPTAYLAGSLVQSSGKGGAVRLETRGVELLPYDLSGFIACRRPRAPNGEPEDERKNKPDKPDLQLVIRLENRSPDPFWLGVRIGPSAITLEARGLPGELRRGD